MEESNLFSSVARLGVYCLDEQIIHIQQSVQEIWASDIHTSMTLHLSEISSITKLRWWLNCAISWIFLSQFTSSVNLLILY